MTGAAREPPRSAGRGGVPPEEPDLVDRHRVELAWPGARPTGQTASTRRAEVSRAADQRGTGNVGGELVRILAGGAGRVRAVRDPFADVPVAVIDPLDVAAAAARTLTTRGHHGKVYRLTGPQALPAERVRLLGEALGRDLRLGSMSAQDAYTQMNAAMPRRTSIRRGTAHSARPDCAPENTPAPHRRPRGFAMDDICFLRPDTMFSAPAFSHVAVIPPTATTIVVGGQNAVDVSGALVGGNDIAAQTRQAFANVAAALRAAGATTGDLVSLTILLVEGAAIESGYEAAAEFLDLEAGPPLVTVIFVARLAVPGALVEVAAIAAVV